MPTAMPTALPKTQASAQPALRNAAGAGADRATASDFSRLLSQASEGQGATSGSPAASSGGTPPAATGATGATAAAGSDQADQPAEAARELAEPRGAQALTRKGSAAPGGERKTGLRNAIRSDSAAAAAAAAAAKATESTPPTAAELALRPGQAGEAGAAQAARAQPAEGLAATALPAPGTAPQIPVAGPAPVAANAQAAEASASGAPAAGRRAGATAQAVGSAALPPSATQALQAAQPDAAAPTAPRSFGDALAAAAQPATAAPEGRFDISPALPQSPLLPTTLPGAMPAAAAATPMPQATLAAPPGSAAFAPQLGAQLTTFVRQGVEHAQLHLNPAEMGPVTVQIQLAGDTARVHLAAEHLLTRQALEQAMPQLASSLREAGLTLSGGGVFEQAQQGRDQADGGRRRDDQHAGQGPGARGGDTAFIGADSGVLRRRGVVDLVA